MVNDAKEPAMMHGSIHTQLYLVKKTKFILTFLCALLLNVMAGGLAFVAASQSGNPAVAPYANMIAIAVMAMTTVLTVIDFFFAPILTGLGLFNANAGVGLARDRILNTLDIKKPEVRSTLFKRRNGQGLPFFQKMEALGYMSPVARNYRLTYEDDWIHQTIFLGSAITPDANYAVAGTAGAGRATFTLGNSGTTNSFIQYDNGSSIPVNANGQYIGNPAYAQSASTSLYAMPLQLNDRLRFRNGAMAHVIALSGTGTNSVTVTIKFSVFADRINVADYTTGDEISVATNAWSDGSKQPRGNNTNVIQGMAYTQILKGGFSWDGAQETDQLWFDYVWEDPSTKTSLLGYVVLGQDNAEYELDLKCDNAILFEQPTTNYYIDPLTDEPTRTTEGIFPAVTRAGHNFPYLAGGWSMANFDIMERVLDKEFSPDNQCFLQGFNLQQEMSTVMKDFNQNTAVNYTEKQMVQDLFGGNEALAMAVNFARYKKTRFNWFFVPLPQLTHPKIHPTGYTTGTWGLTFPMGTATDPKTKKQEPYFGVIYKAKGGKSRKRIVWTLSGGAPDRMNVMEDDLSQLCMLTEIGAEHRGLNQFCRWYT